MVSIGTIKTTGSVSNPSTILARWLYLVPKEISASIKPNLVAFLPIGIKILICLIDILSRPRNYVHFPGITIFPIKELASERKLVLVTTCGFRAPPSRKKEVYPVIPTIDIADLNLAKDAVISVTE